MYPFRDRIIHTTAFVTPVVVHWMEREIEKPIATHSVIGINFRPAVHQVGYGCILHRQLNHSCPGEPFIYSSVQGKMEINVLFSVSRVWQVGQVPWAPLEGGRHSNGLFLTYATWLTFLTV